MTKTEMIHSIFGDGNKFTILKDRIDTVSLKYIEKCCDFYNSQEDKEKAREFIFGLLNR